MKVLARDARKAEPRDVVVLGISGDSPEEHKRFATALGVRFPLLSDAGLEVAKTYGVHVPTAEGGYAARSVFLVDKEGKLRFVDRDFGVPKSLEETKVWEEIAKLPVAEDPAAALAALPSPEKEGKTVLLRFVQSVLGEDAIGLDAVLHPELGAREGETPAMARERRKAFVAKWRELFEKHDLKAFELAKVLDLRAARVVTKATAATGLGTVGAEAKQAAAQLREGELLVVARTSAPKVEDVVFLPRELVLVLRKDGEAWKIGAVR